MDRTITIKIVERTLNALELCGILVVLLAAFVFQFAFKELPCPLCLLQRVGFILIAFGFILNLRFGLRPSHYALVILSAVFTAFVALRQVALHVVPGGDGYGSAVFGLHMYTWSFIVCVLVIIVTSIMLSVDRQYLRARRPFTRWKLLVSIFLAIIFLFVTLNLISTIMECGFRQCPDNPTHYIHVP